MRAVTFQAPGEVQIDEVAEPELLEPDDAIVRVQASGICGSDLHIYHGRVQIEPGFTIGHEYVGTVIAAGDDVTRVAVGERVLGCFQTACGTCFFCLRGVTASCETRIPLDQSSPLRTGDGRPIFQGLRTAAFAEQVVVAASQAVALPDTIPIQEAALLGCGVLTGVGAVVNTAHVAAGESVVVIGAGGVGINGIQGAAAAGSSTPNRARSAK